MNPPHSHPARQAQVALMVALGVWLAGCSTSTYVVKVDAISKPASVTGATIASPQSYKLKSKNPALGEENLRYKEAADFVKTALSGKGLYEAPSMEKADMIVELDYGMDTPRKKVERVSVPVYAQTGGGVRYEQVPIVDTRGNQSVRTVAVYDTPRTELVGYNDMNQQVTIYEKYLRITARENRPGPEGRPPAEVWSVSATAEDESKDLRKYLPIMASATIDYIGKDSTSQKSVRIKDPSQLTEFVKKGMPESVPASAPAKPAG